MQRNTLLAAINCNFFAYKRLKSKIAGTETGLFGVDQMSMGNILPKNPLIFKALFTIN